MEITELILKNGLSMVVMALIVMILVGIVKIFTKGIVNKKEHSEKVQKWLSKLYLGLALLFSNAIVLLYYALILKENCWSIAALRDTGIVWTVTSPLYQIYKQFGGRKLLVGIVSAIQKMFKGKDKNVDDLLNIVMGVLENDAPLLTDAQKETIQSELKEKLNVKNGTVSKEETETK